MKKKYANVLGFSLILLIFPHFLGWAQDYSFIRDRGVKKYSRIYNFSGEAYDYSCGAGTGLKSTYFSDSRLRWKSKRQQHEPNIDFYLVREAPAPGIRGDKFSIRWEGYVFAPVDGTYTFTAMADDGMRIWFEDRIVMDEWRQQEPSKFAFQVELNGGEAYKIEVEYSQMMYDYAVAQLFWEYPGQFHTIVPIRYLFPTKPENCVTERIAEVPKKKIVEQRKEPMALKPKVEQPEKVTPEIETAKIKTAPVQVTTYDELAVAKSVTLKNVLFEQGKYHFREGDAETLASLDRLVATLKKYPALRIEVAGHTDDVGRYYANERLSRNRAQRVASYLMQHGISDRRLEVKGYGSNRPISTNETLEGRALNRRVEVKVLE